MHHPVLDEHPRALEVDHAAGDQVAGVDLVVEAERQPLQLPEVVEPQLVGDLLADPLGLELRQAGQQALDQASRRRRAPPLTHRACSRARGQGGDCAAGACTACQVAEGAQQARRPGRPRDRRCAAPAGWPPPRPASRGSPASPAIGLAFSAIITIRRRMCGIGARSICASTSTPAASPWARAAIPPPNPAIEISVFGNAIHCGASARRTQIRERAAADRPAVGLRRTTLIRVTRRTSRNASRTRQPPSAPPAPPGTRPSSGSARRCGRRRRRSRRRPRSRRPAAAAPRPAISAFCWRMAAGPQARMSARQASTAASSPPGGGDRLDQAPGQRASPRRWSRR